MKKLPLVGLVLGMVAALFSMRKRKAPESAPDMESAPGTDTSPPP